MTLPLAQLFSAISQEHVFMLGAICALNLTAALLFLRFYRRTRDRLFLLFAAAFALMGANRVLFWIFGNANDSSAEWYLLRLAAFGLIVFAIVDKNRARR